MRLAMSDAEWGGLLDHMNSRREHAAFMFATQRMATELEVTESWLLTESDYEISEEDHLVLDDEVRPRVIARAHETGTAAIEAHSHSWPGPRTRFSPYDLRGLVDFAPHMLWRLPGRPYVALVVGVDSFDGLWWSGRDRFGALQAVETETSNFEPSGLSLAAYEELRSWGDARD